VIYFVDVSNDDNAKPKQPQLEMSVMFVCVLITDSFGIKRVTSTSGRTAAENTAS